MIALLLLLSAAAIVWIKAGERETAVGNEIALIYQNDAIIGKFDLNKDQVVDLLNGRMKIEVRASRIRVASSDCPKQICVNTGWIENPREVIVCVPYSVLVEIEAPEAPFLDAVVR